MNCIFCNNFIEQRSNHCVGYSCQLCQADMNITIIPDPDAIASPDSPTQPGREVIHSTVFFADFNNNRYKISFFPFQNETLIELESTFKYASPTLYYNSKEIKRFPGQILSPQNIHQKLPVILTFL